MFIKKLYFLPILFIMLFTLVGCNNTDDNINGDQTNFDGEGTSYGLVNKSYIGMANVKVKNKKVESVTYDEAFLPTSWANINVTVEEGKDLPDDVILHSKDGKDNYYAKYISIDNQLFTGTLRESDLVLDDTIYSTQVVKYSNEKIPDLFSYLYNSDSNCEWYYNAVKNNKVFICDKDGKKLETYPSLHEYGWFKSEGKYWNATEGSPLGWKGNIDNLVDYLKGKELTSLDSTKFQKDSEGVEENGYNYKYWTIDGVKTKVTMTDVYAYYKLAHSAYMKAMNTSK